MEKKAQKSTLKSAGRMCLLFAALFLLMTACGPDPFYVPVLSINDVPETGEAGTPLALKGKVSPGFASNKSIIWLVEDAGTTGAVINGNILNTTACGTVLIQARVANGRAEGRDYTQEFKIVITEKGEQPVIPSAYYDVTFESNGGSDIDPQSVAEGQKAQKPDDPVKPGFDFVNWYDNEGLIDPPYNFDTPVTSDIILYAYWIVTGTAVPVDGVTLNTATLNLNVGETETLTAEISPSGATNKAVSWSSGNPAVATVDTYGLVTAIGAGSAVITVTTADGGFTADCTVTVRAIDVLITSVTLIPSTLTLTAGDTAILTAAITPSNATNKSVTWSSDNTSVATVNNGTVTAFAAGSAVITVTTADGGHQATCAVTVTLPTVKEARIASTGEETTLADALVKAANGSLSAPTEIIILRNIIAVRDGDNPYAYSIPTGKNIKLNVEAGKEITITAADGNFCLFSVSNTGSSLTLGPTAGGGTLTLSGGNAAAQTNRRGVYVEGGGRTLILNTGVTITGFKNSSNSTTVGGGGVYVNGGTFTMNGGAISGNDAIRGSGVHVNSGTFTMNDGEVSGNTATNGGGVYVYGGTFAMSGGEISGNTASTYGCGVYLNNADFTMSGGAIKNNTASSSNTGGGGGVYTSGTFTMNSGEISGNTAERGGGVFVASTGKFAIEDGKISGNTASTSGGGVFVNAVDGNSGTFTMNSGEISGNTASTNGGGVCVNPDGIFTMNSGEISGNTAGTFGGGVNAWGTFTMNGGTISGNTASTTSGGGVSVGSNGTFTMKNGTIESNNAGQGGGGVFVNSTGEFTMEDGTISGNTASTYGGGVCVNSDGIFTMSGGTIHGTNASTSLQNKASSGASVASFGTAKYGGAYGSDVINTTNNTLPSPVTGVTLNKTSTSLTVDATETLTATVAPSSATIKTVTWSSNNATVATVNSSGTVTAVSAGSATITVTTVEGSKTATCVVTVNKPAAPAVTFPTAAAITYGAALSTSSLSGGTIGRGDFAWQNPATIPTATNSGYPMEFTPNDTSTYDYTNVSGWNGTKVERTVSITVNKAAGSNVTAPIVEGDPATSAIKVTTPSTLITPATGQSIEYAISASASAAPASLSWTTELTFTVSADGITLNKDYYVYARSAAGANYEAGTPNKSAPVGIYPAYASIIITFAQITDAAPDITGPTLSRSGTGYQKTALLQIDGSGYTSISWEITGTGITETGASFTLNATDSRYNQIGEHHLTLIVYKDGVPYNKTVIFKIVG